MCTIAVTPGVPEPIPPPVQCIFGWLEVPASVGLVAQADAVYHAPAAAGVYHVRARAELTVQVAETVPSTAETTAAITVAH